MYYKTVKPMLSYPGCKIAILLAFIAGVLALFASVYSLTAGHIYEEAIRNKVFSASLMPGTLSQDSDS